VKPKALLLVDIGQLLTMRSTADGPRRGASLSELGIIPDAAVLCLGGKIVSVGTTKDALRDPWLKTDRKKIVEIDCGGRVVLPGFVDSHTHPVFAHPRLVDFEKRISGASYEEIAAAGGGIRSSVDGVRKASKSALTRKVSSVLEDLARHGTTTVEAKSGYGLNLGSEVKSLEAIRAAAREWPGAVVPTFLGAHAVPPEYRGRSQEYVDLVCNEMIPVVAKRKLARFVDVFCDRGAFSSAEALQIFTAAEKNGLAVRAHVGQLSETRLGPLLRFQPASLDHMDHVNDSDLPALARSDTIATFVPGANYFLGLARYPNARRFIESGAAVALATDYNPGSSPTLSMAMAMSLACT
jgi:imidazolonepropionase